MVSRSFAAAAAATLLAACAGCGASSGSSQVATGGNVTTTTATAVSFDSTRAFVQLQAQCALGPRPMGTPVHDQCRDYIVQQLTPNVDIAPILQSFPYTSPKTGASFTATNIIGRINPTAATQVMLAAHWDTRPVADQDPNPANWTKPILGADDGASEVAVLLELARVFHANKPTVGVEFMFFDGEDYAPIPQYDTEMYMGSKYFAAHPSDPVSGASLKPTYCILLDMIGDLNLDIYEEKNSLNAEPQLVQKVWGAAQTLGYGSSFIAQPKYEIDDDHLPLLQAGIPTVDCIDFDFEQYGSPSNHWHTLTDIPANCSAQSLQIVGNVMSKVVYDEK